MSTQITLNWEKDSTFETLLDGHKVTIDRDAENGGDDEGPRLKVPMFVASARCSAIDVIPLFNKVRVCFEKVSVDAKAKSSDAIPIVYTAFHMTYHIRGNREDAARIDKAIRLLQEKYYGVGLMVKKITPITHEILLNGEPLKLYPNGR